MEDEMYSVGEVAFAAGVNAQTIRNRIERLNLDISRSPSGRRRITREQAKTIIDSIKRKENLRDYIYRELE